MTGGVRWRGRAAKATATATVLAGALALAAAATGGCVPRPLISQGLFERAEDLRETLAPAGDIGLAPPRRALASVTLPSGLRVGFEQAPARGMVGVVLVVGEGSTADPPGKEGLAHLVEHLVFHARFEGRPVSEGLGRLGASYNADTGLDRTLYYAFAPMRALPALLRMVAQRLDEPLAGVDRAAFAIEREIVENELRQRNETAVYGQVGAWMQTALFAGDHPYARAIGGSVDSLRRLTLDDAQALVRRGGYSPRQATLLVVGDFDPAAAAATAERDLPASLVGKSSRRPPPPSPSPSTVAATVAVVAPSKPPPAPPSGHTIMKAPVAWPEIWLVYSLADLYGPYAQVTKVLTTAVVERTLRKELEQDPDVGEVSLDTLAFKQATVLACNIRLLAPERRQEIADKARRLIASLWVPEAAAAAEETPGGGGEITEAGLRADAPRLALADAILASEPFAARALARAEFFHMTGSLSAYDAVINGVAALQPDEVTRHGLYLLAPERARVLYVEPLEDAARPPPGAVGVPAVGNRPAMPGGPSAGLDFGEPPPSPPAPELAGAATMMLASGVRVVLVRRPQFPGVTAVLGFGGGAGAAPAGVVELLRLLEREGTFELRQNAIQVQKLDGPDITADMVVTGPRNLSNALLLLAGRLRVLDKLRWREVLGGPQRAQRPDREPPNRKAARAFWRALYGTHPYGRSLAVADLRGVQAAQMEGWLPRIYNPFNATLVVAGDINIESARRLAMLWFASWRADQGIAPVDVPPVPPVPPMRAPAARQVIVTHRPITSQVEVALGCRLPPTADLRGLAAARMLAGAVVGQLRTALREEAGAAYSVSGSATVLRGGGAHLVLGASLDTRRLVEALREIDAHWRAFAGGQFDRGTLSQVRWDLVLAENLGYQTSTETAVRVLDAANLGWSPPELAGLPDLYRQIGAADLARLFATCRGTTVLSLLGDEPTIRAALREVGPGAGAR